MKTIIMKKLIILFIFLIPSAFSFGQNLGVLIDGAGGGTGTKASNNNTNLFTVNYGSETSLTLDFSITGASPTHNSSLVTIDNGTTTHSSTTTVTFFGFLLGSASIEIFRTGGTGDIQVNGGTTFTIHYDENANGTVDGDDVVIEITTVTLPVELISFYPELERNEVLLKWSTATEKNNEKFEIEASQDGIDFHKIGEIDGHGTTTEEQQYSFIVENPNSGLNYYRLKQIDFDGQFDYSSIVNVTIDQDFNKTTKISPNPVQNELNIVDGQGQATIYNLLGQPVKQFSINNKQFRIGTKELAEGQYILLIQRENGQIVTKRFMK